MDRIKGLRDRIIRKTEEVEQLRYNVQSRLESREYTLMRQSAEQLEKASLELEDLAIELGSLQTEEV